VGCDGTHQEITKKVFGVAQPPKTAKTVENPSKTWQTFGSKPEKPRKNVKKL